MNAKAAKCRLLAEVMNSLSSWVTKKKLHESARKLAEGIHTSKSVIPMGHKV